MHARHSAPSPGGALRGGRHRAASRSSRAVVPLAVLSTSVLVAGVAAAGTLDPGTAARPLARTSPAAAPTAPAAPAGPAAPVALAVRPAAAGPAAYSAGDPATWSSAQLAAQLVFSCVRTSDLGRAVAQAGAGVGGIVVLGKPTDAAGLTRGLAAVRAAGPHGIAPLIASDEEGGRVQRLKGLLGPLPSAAEMGRWSDGRIEQTARDYGAGMRRLGVQLALSPVADLGSPGAFLSKDGRAFSTDPRRVAGASVAWSRGLERAGVLSAVKHWPGHGRAADSHTSAPAAPPLAELQRSDLVPFDAVLRSGARVVMVGHLRSAGLTEPGLPATLSPNAMRVLRERAGPRTVVLTDSLSMAASSAALGIRPAEAAVRSLQAGADWAMSCVDPLAAVGAVRAALDERRLPRAAAVASARRILDVKQRLGLLAVRPVTAPPAGTLTAASLTGDVVTVLGTARDADTPAPPVVRVLVDGVVAAEVRQAGSPAAFSAAVPVRPGGEVCVVALNTGPGAPTPLGCVRRP